MTKQITVVLSLLLLLVMLPILYVSIEVVAPETPYDITQDYITTTNSSGEYALSLVVVVDENSNVYGIDALDGSSGTPEWTYTPSTGTVTGIAIKDDGIWLSVSDTSNRMEQIDISTGVFVDSFVTTPYFYELEVYDADTLVGLDWAGGDEAYIIDTTLETTTLRNSVISVSNYGLRVDGEYFTVNDDGRTLGFVYRVDGTDDGYTTNYTWTTYEATMNGTMVDMLLDISNTKLYGIELDGDFLKLTLDGLDGATEDWFGNYGDTDVQAFYLANDNDIIYLTQTKMERYPNEDPDTATAEYTVTYTNSSVQYDASYYVPEQDILFRGDNTGYVTATDTTDGSELWNYDFNVGVNDITAIAYYGSAISLSEFTTSTSFTGTNGLVKLVPDSQQAGGYYQVCYAYTYDGTTNDLALTITDETETVNEVDNPQTTTEKLYDCTEGLNFATWNDAHIYVTFTNAGNFTIYNPRVLDRCVGSVCTPNTLELYEDYYETVPTNLTQYRSLFDLFPILSIASAILILVMYLRPRNN